GSCGEGCWPFGRTPSRMARSTSLALQPPMPVSRSGVMFAPLTLYSDVSQLCGPPACSRAVSSAPPCTRGVWQLPQVRIPSTRYLPRSSGGSAAATPARAGAENLWAGTVVIHPKAKTGAHHHGPVESVIYVVSGKARMRWGDKLEFVAEAGPGDFIYVPPFVPHQEINASDTEPLSCVLCRSGQQPVVVNLDIPVVEKPEEVHWVDNIHPAPKS